MYRSNSNRLRLTGKLIKGDRRYVLQCDDQSVWKLDFLDIEVPKDNDIVLVEGVKTGIDSIAVDWIGESQ
ncbi:DUF5818 domain-containing protein [Sphingorhabdus sp. EL138]|uniref:DUF5818 domain-containing protein n=1 Tax=Sphingorhabdus sp. EL138 TaxID=2073156 RepID=UPI000D69FDE5